MNPPIDVTRISQLIDLARQDDEEAFGAICGKVQPYLEKMAIKHLDPALRQKLNPSDIAQLTITRMLQGFDDFRGSSSREFYGWMNAILANEVHSVRRSYHRIRRDIKREHSIESAGGVLPTSEQLTPEQLLIHRENKERLFKAMADLPEDYATIIELRGVKELPFADIAERMGKSVNAVSKLWQRAIAKLGEELENQDESWG